MFIGVMQTHFLPVALGQKIETYFNWGFLSGYSANVAYMRTHTAKWLHETLSKHKTQYQYRPHIRSN